MQPQFVYDDDCGFCTWWAELFVDHADVELVGFTDLEDELRARLPDDYEECAHLVTAETVYSCGKAIEETLARSDVGPVVGPLFDQLDDVGPYAALRERAYRETADRRALWGRVLSSETTE